MSGLITANGRRKRTAVCAREELQKTALLSNDGNAPKRIYAYCGLSLTKRRGISLDGKSREGSSPLYHRSPGNMLATVALLACFAVVVMPSLFTVAPNRRAGLPGPADSTPQAAVSAPVEMSQLTAISALVEMPQPPAVPAVVETPLPAAVSALVKTSQPIAFAHWLASDLFRLGRCLG
jgi:hypothetical protein